MKTTSSGKLINIARKDVRYTTFEIYNILLNSEERSVEKGCAKIHRQDD